MLTKSKFKKWLNLFLLFSSLIAIPIGWLAANASVGEKLGGTLVVIAALFASLPSRKKEIMNAVDGSWLPDDETTTRGNREAGLKALNDISGYREKIERILKSRESGMARIPAVGILLFVFACLFCFLVYASSARADDSPQFGGCFAAGDFCAGPAVALTVGQYNLTTSKFSGGVVPGVGYGITYKPYLWYATGVAAYLSFSVGGGQPNEAIPSVLFSFANYVRFGAGMSVSETDGAARTQWRLLFGLGADFGGSPKYAKGAP